MNQIEDEKLINQSNDVEIERIIKVNDSLSKLVDERTADCKKAFDLMQKLDK
jgi:hypothetical protein